MRYVLPEYTLRCIKIRTEMKSLLGLRYVPIRCAILLTLSLLLVRATEANLQSISNGDCESSAGSTRLDSASTHISNPLASGTSVEVLFSQSYGSAVNTGKDSVQVIGASPVPTVAGSIQNFSLSGNGYPITSVNVVWSSVSPLIQSWLRKLAGQDSIIVEFSSASARNGNPQFQNIVQGRADIFPTPEPVSFALLGSGLIIVGGVLRRRLR